MCQLKYFMCRASLTLSEVTAAGKVMQLIEIHLAVIYQYNLHVYVNISYLYVTHNMYYGPMGSINDVTSPTVKIALVL